ncbi:MAG: DUF3299 domain-containing protein [Aquisalimonadaceae bacterium]
MKTIIIPLRTVCTGILLTLVLAGCGGEDAAVDNQSSPARVAQQSAARTPAPSIRIYMTDLKQYGEVAGVTAASDELVNLTLRLETAGGEAMGNQTLEISSLVGNEISEDSPRTDADGFARIDIHPKLPGEDILTITGGGISKQLSIYITDEAYGRPLEHLETRATELPEVEGVVPWSTMTGIETREGNHGLLVPVFNDEVRSLNGKDVRIQGFMLPLENTEQHSHFMLTSTPPSCFFCLPGGPESIVEVKADRPVDFSFEPVVLAGRMELMEDSDMGLFYRLNGAKVEK